MSPPVARATSPSFTSTRRKATNCGCALSSPAAPKIGFLKVVLYTFYNGLRRLYGAGDETGLGRQICWEANKKFGYRFRKINFSSQKHDIGFSLMNQLSVAQKRFPRGEQDIAADYFALRKRFHANKWVFTEGKNTLNPASHCDIAWAGGLATESDRQYACAGAAVA